MLRNFDIALTPNFLIELAIKGTILLGAVALATLYMRRSSAASRHLAWCIGLAGLLILPGLSLVLPELRILPTWVPAPREYRSQMTPGNMEGVQRPMIPSPAKPGSKQAGNEPGPATPGVSSWIVPVWMCGTALLLLRLMISQAGLIWLRRRSRLLDRTLLHEELRLCARELGVRTSVTLLCAIRKRVPMTWGVFRPCVLLPAEAVGWPADLRRAVMLHELAHIQRRDCLAQWLIQLVCAVHWFNPLVWLAARQADLEREQACDDLVLGAGVRAPDYAGYLLDIATFKQSALATPGAMAMARSASIEHRVRTVLDKSVNRQGPSRRTLAIALLMCGAVMIPLARLRSIAQDSARGKAESTNPPALALPRERTDLTGFQVRLTSKEIKLRLAEDDFARNSKLFEKNLISQAEYDRARVLVEIRRAEMRNDMVEVKRLQLRQAEQDLVRVGQLHKKHLVSETDLQEARTNVDLRKAELAETPEPSSKGVRNFARLVVGTRQMTFESKPTAWEQLPELLSKVPNRSSTVLELALESDQMTIAQLHEAQGRTTLLGQRAGFEYVSYIGVHPLGSKGSAENSR